MRSWTGAGIQRAHRAISVPRIIAGMDLRKSSRLGRISRSRTLTLSAWIGQPFTFLMNSARPNNQREATFNAHKDRAHQR